MKVKDVMIKDVIAVEPSATVKEAADLMNLHKIGCLVVKENEKAMGIVTERDLIKRVISEAKNPTKTKVHDIMSTPLTIVEPNMNLEDAAKLMLEFKIKKLPVLENGRLVGLVSLTDIVHFSEGMINALKKMFNILDNPTP